MARPRTGLAVLLALPVCLVAVRAIGIEVSDFFDPCFSWAVPNPGTGFIRANDPCVEHSGTSETKIQAAVRTAGVSGVIILAAVLGIWGEARSRRKMTAIGACLMILEAIPLVFSVWPLPLLAGAGFIWLARRDFEPPR
ncbi:MAG: hypothetical protein ABSF98_15065 [Bryobacteraceae bacterium]|jgi:hypothetical protein